MYTFFLCILDLLADDENDGINVAQIALELLEWAESKKINNASVDALLHRLRHMIMPKLLNISEEDLENMPDTYAKAKQLLYPLIETYQEVHFCAKGCMRFKNYEPGTKKDKKDLKEKCTKCGLTRFDKHNKPRYLLLPYKLHKNWF
jgi:hypothetical protein